MKKTLCFTFVLACLAAGSVPSVSQSRGQRDIRARAEIEAERERRDRIQEELKAATEELAALTGVLLEEVAQVDGYTLSMEILESSNRIEELAKQIEEIARTINRRAQGR